MATRGLGGGVLGEMPLGQGGATTASVKDAGLGAAPLGGTALGSGSEGLSGVAVVSAGADRQQTAKTDTAGVGEMALGGGSLGGGVNGYSGAGTISKALAAINTGGAASLSSVGAVSAATEVQIGATTSLSAAGTLTTRYGLVRDSVASLTAAGALTASFTRIRTVSAIRSGLGGDKLGSAPLGGSDGVFAEGLIDPAAITGVVATTALAGDGSFSTLATRGRTTDTSLSGDGLLSVSAAGSVPATTQLAGVGVLSAVSEPQVTGGAALVSDGSLTPSPAAIYKPTIGLSGQGLQNVNSTRHRTTDTSLTGVATVGVDAARSEAVATALVALGSLGVEATVELLASSALAANGDITNAVIALLDWRIGGQSVQQLQDEERDIETLTLTFRSSEQQVVETLRPLDENAGEVEILPRGGGGFVAQDTVGGANTYTIEAPDLRDDVRYISSWVVEEYDDRVVDQAGNVYEATLKLVADENKEPQNSYGTKTRGSGEWKIEANAGDIVTDRVEADISRSGKDGVEGVALSLVLEPEEVKIIEESASRPNAISTRAVPDGESYTNDANGRNTVTITPPSAGDNSIEQGDYIITGWRTTQLNKDFYELRLELA